MSFSYIHPIRFRNLGDEAVQVSSSEVFFIGENGQGKTNFLESIYYLCYASSFRVYRDDLLCRYQSSEMSVKGSFCDDDDLVHSVFTKYENKKKTVIFDGNRLRDRKELVHQLPCIVFTHDDMALIKGNPEYRRRFINQTVSLYDPLSIDELRTYSRVLKMRNEAVKRNDSAIIDVLNMQLAAAGLVVQQRREIVINEFNETFIPLFREVSGLSETLCIQYNPSWKSCDSVEKITGRLEDGYKNDRIMKTTTTGPHRDRILFRLGTRDFAPVASTGQTRLIALVLKIAQSIYFSRKTGRKAVFLIDDVLLELDLPKRKSILNLLPPYKQAFFTFLPDEPYLEYAKSDTLILRVKDGRAMTE